MSKKQIAALAAVVLTTIAGTLSQCKDESPIVAPRTGSTVVDAGPDTVGH
jgi:hypothetical protein